MRVSLVALCTVGLVASAPAEVHVVRHPPGVGRTVSAAVLPKAELLVPLTDKVHRKGAKKHLLEGLIGKSTTVPLTGANFDHEYVTDATFGGQKFKLIVDTGSSDTWVIQQGFTCLNPDTGDPQPAQSCNFGPGFSPAQSTTFQLFPNVTFAISYGDGSFVDGPAGFDTISIGDLSVTKQEIGVPNVAGWFGDGITSGILGLAFPDTTSVYNTTNLQDIPSSTRLFYNPFFFTAVQEKKVTNSYFSIALNRPSFAAQLSDDYTPNLGILAFGGIAPVSVQKTSVTVPIQGYTVRGDVYLPTNRNPEYIFYSVDVQSFSFPGGSYIPSPGIVLDSGTTLNVLPAALARAYNAQFKPKAQYDAQDNLYIVACNAKAPVFSVKIGGVVFTIDPQDQVLPAGTDENGNEVCISGTQSGGPDLPGEFFILGDVFLHNVVTTFNPIQREVTITQRAPY
ncbi:aspartic peptidase domain-containing protein [Mycena latifolia]|nr:aspartic peptidase domain-containing protein [Mycena latifolia]